MIMIVVKANFSKLNFLQVATPLDRSVFLFSTNARYMLPLSIQPCPDLEWYLKHLLPVTPSLPGV